MSHQEEHKYVVAHDGMCDL